MLCFELILSLSFCQPFPFILAINFDFNIEHFSQHDCVMRESSFKANMTENAFESDVGSENTNSSWVTPSSDLNLNFAWAIPDSDPNFIHHLWSQVSESQPSNIISHKLPLSHASSTKASFQRNSALSKTDNRCPSRASRVSNPDIHVQHKDYREKCLLPKGIQIGISSILVENAHKHFGTGKISDY